MTETENAIEILKEELGEMAIELLLLQQQIGKAVRFGIDEQRDLPTSNRERIEAEWNDVLGSLKNLTKYGIDLIPNMELVTSKIEKIHEYTDYSIELGTVEKYGFTGDYDQLVSFIHSEVELDKEYHFTFYEVDKAVR